MSVIRMYRPTQQDIEQRVAAWRKHREEQRIREQQDREAMKGFLFVVALVVLGLVIFFS